MTPALLLLATLLFGDGADLSPADETEFVGFVTDTECGPDHAPMIARGDMGSDSRECTYRCVARGATFGFVEAGRAKFLQLDDQDASRPYAGWKVRIVGRLEGDTIHVTSIARTD